MYRTRIARLRTFYWVVQALARIASRLEPDCDPANENTLLRSRLQLMRRARSGLDALYVSGEDSHPKFILHREALLAARRPPNSVHVAGGAPEEHLDELVDVLANPEQVLALDRVKLRLDAMNIIRSPETAGATDLDLTEITTKLPTPRSRTVALIRFRRSEIPPPGFAWDEVARFFG